MLKFAAALLVLTAFTSAACAADKPVIGPAPTWVIPVTLPKTEPKPDEAAVQILLLDQQVALEPGQVTTFSEAILKIQTPQGLSAGNISFPWRPETDVLTVHKLLIKRGDQTIDVLGSGQTFTVIRREQNLETATLDGVLTANIQPEGLQVGDILQFATSVTSRDPVLQGHVEQVAAAGWNAISIGRAHMRMQWPESQAVRFRQIGALPPIKPTKTGDTASIELSLDNVTPVIRPSGAPGRYAINRMVEVTDFASWADMATLLAPLYEKTATMPAQGPLLAELERIRALSPDPKIRAEAALALVQDRIRYVALAMGTGGLVPADVETTWARRYGDCKAKTVLLLALLHALDIQADPVAVSSVFGDGMDARLPMIGLFNHVLVRATIGGRTYWLDGTRTKDTSLDRLTVPAFGWGLPLVKSGAMLARMLPTPLDAPTRDVAITIDATAGISIPAPFKVETTLRGDDAIATNSWVSNMSGQVREAALRDYWRDEYDFVDIKSTNASFDPKTGEQRLMMEGLARMDWDDGLYLTNGTDIGYKADFHRDLGQDQTAPFAVVHPVYTRVVETVTLPKGVAASSKGMNDDIDQTVAGVQYRRQVTISDDVFRVEAISRSIAFEFAAKDAAEAQAALRKLSEHPAFISKPENYRLTDEEFNIWAVTKLTTADAFVERGKAFLSRSRLDEAGKDFEQAIALDPKNSVALSARGDFYMYSGKLDDAQKYYNATLAIDQRMAGLWAALGF